MVGNRMKLVDDYRDAWRWASVRFNGAALAVQATWASLSDDMRSEFPKHAVTVLTVALLIMGTTGRLIKQERKNVSNDDSSVAKRTASDNPMGSAPKRSSSKLPVGLPSGKQKVRAKQAGSKSRGA